MIAQKKRRQHLGQEGKEKEVPQLGVCIELYLADRIARVVTDGTYWNSTGRDWLRLHGKEWCELSDFQELEWVARLLLRRAGCPADEALGLHGGTNISCARITLPLPVAMDLAAAVDGDAEIRDVSKTPAREGR